VFAGAVNREDGAACKPLGLSRARRLKWLWMMVKPDLDDAIAASAFIDAASDRLHLRQFRHRLIVEDRVAGDRESDAALRDSMSVAMKLTGTRHYTECKR